jgi:activating signal cointegrator complex subunit 1
VASCRNRLILLISTARHQRSFTHLLTFPINFDQLKTRFANFRELVLKNCARDRGVDASIFQVPNKFHLTICTLTLLDKSEIEQAKDILDQCKFTFINELVSETKPLRVRVQGLEYMNDDPGDVDVLYAKINPVGGANLQQVADKLMMRFVEKIIFNLLNVKLFKISLQLR